MTDKDLAEIAVVALTMRFRERGYVFTLTHTKKDDAAGMRHLERAKNTLAEWKKRLDDLIVENIEDIDSVIPVERFDEFEGNALRAAIDNCKKEKYRREEFIKQHKK